MVPWTASIETCSFEADRVISKAKGIPWQFSKLSLSKTQDWTSLHCRDHPLKQEINQNALTHPMGFWGFGEIGRAHV